VSIRSYIFYLSTITLLSIVMLTLMIAPCLPTGRADMPPGSRADSVESKIEKNLIEIERSRAEMLSILEGIKKRIEQRKLELRAVKDSLIKAHSVNIAKKEGNAYGGKSIETGAGNCIAENER